MRYFILILLTVSGTALAADFKVQEEIPDHNVFTPWPAGGGELSKGTHKAWMYERQASEGSGTQYLVTNRLKDGELPNTHNTAYAFKAKSITHSGYNPDHIWGWPRIGMISAQGECIVAANNASGHCQGGAFVAKHWNDTSHGKLVGLETVTSVRSDESVGPDFWNEPDATLGITINSDPANGAIASSAIKIAGSDPDVWYNGVSLKRNRIVKRAFWPLFTRTARPRSARIRRVDDYLL